MDPLGALRVRPCRREDAPSVIALWAECDLLVPWNDPRKDIEMKLRFQPELFLVGELEGRVVATVMAGYEGHRGWINYLAASPELQRSGLGRQMLEAAEAALSKLGCPKINLLVRERNRGVIAFYERLGYQVDATICLGKRLDG